MEILFEKQAVAYLGLPSLPKKEFDGKTSFNKGVAVITLFDDREAYAIAKFDADKDEKPRIVKVFSQEPFKAVGKVFVVPNYMSTEEEVKTMDLDEQSKKKAEQILEEAREIENEGVAEKTDEPENEYYFDHIHNDEEGRAFIQAYNSKNKIRGKVPKTHEGIIMRLAVIYNDTNKEK